MKLVAGRGTFVDDIQLPRMAYAAIVRSPFAHARIRSIETTSWPRTQPTARRSQAGRASCRR